jgi:hypothetical protein
MPEDAPVTTAVLPSRVFVVSSTSYKIAGAEIG